jgi:hypothetical protein
MTSDGEMTKIKVIDLEKLWNFVVYNFFYLKSFSTSKCYLKFNFEIVEELYFSF